MSLQIKRHSTRKDGFRKLKCLLKCKYSAIITELSWEQLDLIFLALSENPSVYSSVWAKILIVLSDVNVYLEDTSLILFIHSKLW